MPLGPPEVRARVRGLMAFVCTPFTPSNHLDLGRFREHLRYLVHETTQKPAACFVCCGAGEFFSLNMAEYRLLVRAAVEEVGSEVPIFAGTGYGTRMAIEFAVAAEEQGADGVLVFPPYLVSAPQEGLYLHCRSIAAAVKVSVILYSRDNAVFEPATVFRLAEIPNVIGMKDGDGDMESLARIRAELGDSFLLMNGMPLAERYAPAYLAAGVSSYSPCAIDFLPEVTWAFHHALMAGSQVEVDRLLQGFFHPYGELRAQVPGYGISLVKAGLKLRGKPVGGVRPPLVDPSPDHEEALSRLIEQGLSLVQRGV